MKKHICNICGLEFENHSLKANHIRWKHKDQKKYIEKISTLKTDFYLKKLGDLKDFNVKCDRCDTEFIVTEREFKFPEKEKYYCCISCANSNHNMSHSDETKNKLSVIAKKLWGDDKYSNIHLNNNKFSSKGEREIRSFLKERYGNKEVSAHRIISMNNIKKAVDITIKNKNLIIEYDGIWHFDKRIYEKFGTPDKYLEITEKDKMLKEYCLINNIRLLRISDKYYNHNKRKTISEMLFFIEKENLQYKELY